MRVFALSDIHVDYDANAAWVADLSVSDYQQDVLILAGDVAATCRLLEWCLGTLAKRFKKVLFVPGNHELWVTREDSPKNSLQKFDEVCRVAALNGAFMETFRERGVAIVPLLGWYDYSFGEPSEELRSIWMDYRSCRWPIGFTEKDVTAYFVAFNNHKMRTPGDKVITYSHFLPRIDLMPEFIPAVHKVLYPVLGSEQLERQLRRLSPDIHVYGHSHVNRRVTIEGVSYINNAFGYPSETWATAKRLACIYEC